jgi:hypothetical protein
MANVTLKSLHAYLRLLENAPELKRKMPTSSTQRTVKEGLNEIGKLVGIDNAAFKDPQNIAAVIGAQRFVMIWGEPSVTDHVARVFDSSKVLLTVLIDPAHYQSLTSGHMGPASGTAQHQASTKAALSSGQAQAKAEPSNGRVEPKLEPETSLDSLKPLLSGNTTLTCRLFRALFEHMLGVVSQSSTQQGSASLVTELTGSREHSRSFHSTAMFILGAEVDHDNLLSFMMELTGNSKEHSSDRPPMRKRNSKAGSTHSTRNSGESLAMERSLKPASKARQESMLTSRPPICWRP